MRVPKWWRMLCLVIVATLLTSGCTFAGTSGNRDLPETRVLFIGNSFTSYNLGIDQILHGFAPRTTVELDAPGGFMASCVVYSEIFGKSPEGNTFLGGVDPGFAQVLQAMAEKAARGN